MAAVVGLAGCQPADAPGGVGGGEVPVFAVRLCEGEVLTAVEVRQGDGDDLVWRTLLRSPGDGAGRLAWVDTDGYESSGASPEDVANDAELVAVMSGTGGRNLGTWSFTLADLRPGQLLEADGKYLAEGDLAEQKPTGCGG